MLLSLVLARAAIAADEFPVRPEDLPKALLQELKGLGLTAPGAPEIPAFQWRLELKRPLRRARQIQEHFAGSQAGPNSGLSPSFRYDYPKEPPKDGEKLVDKPSGVISVRGLVRVSPEDEHITARIEGINFPLEAKAAFKIFLKEPGIDVNQSCIVMSKTSAAQLHANLKGEASLIECTGRGRYKGFDVKLHSTMYFIDALGMFFNTLDVIDSPLGKLNAITRIVDLKIGS
jgi:hypothetical protein